jgi:hypothetical protein
LIVNRLLFLSFFLFSFFSHGCCGRRRIAEITDIILPVTGTGISIVLHSSFFLVVATGIMHPAPLALRSRAFVKGGGRIVTRLSSKAIWTFIKPLHILFIMSCICQLSDAFRMNSFTRMTSFKLDSRLPSSIISELKPLLADSTVRESDLYKVAEFIYRIEVLHEDRISEFQSKFSQLQMNHQYEKELLEIGNREFTMNLAVEKKCFANPDASLDEMLISNYTLTISHLQKYLEAHEHYHMKTVSLLTQRNMFERLFLSFIDLYEGNSTFKKLVEDYLQTKLPRKTISYAKFSRILLQKEIRNCFGAN